MNKLTDRERSESIIAEIEKRKAVPIPRWHFLLRHAGFWLLAALSVLTGSICMAIAIYVFIDNDFIADKDYINRYFTQQPGIADLVAGIPYLWIIVLLLFTLTATFGFRHTKKGYRYSPLKVITASIVASILLSAALNTVDVGGYIHRYLVENVHVYNNLIYANEQRWTHSEKGLLGGKVIENNRTAGRLLLRDFRKGLWQVDIRKAEIRPGTLIAKGKYLKITGLKTGNGTFQALSIQAWEKKFRKRPPPAPVITPPVRAPKDSLAR